jgi:hypothetical protein
MRRLTARFVLILLLVGVFAPVAMAIAVPTPHACCLRKPMDGGTSHTSEFSAPPGCCQHDCCRPLTVSQWAQLTPAAGTHFVSASATLHSEQRPNPFATDADNAHSGRAPPQFSIA